jgi:multicomponent Na+:H+ antiporter subunit B
LRWVIFLFLAGFAALFIWASSDLPDRAETQAPANQHVSPEYLRRSEADTGAPNVVTAVLADYRGYDTLGETVVILTAGLACVFVLKFSKDDGRSI